jgi:hypothetical protein
MFELQANNTDRVIWIKINTQSATKIVFSNGPIVGFFERRTSSNFLAIFLANYTGRVIWEYSNMQSATNIFWVFRTSNRQQFLVDLLSNNTERVIWNQVNTKSTVRQANGDPSNVK